MKRILFILFFTGWAVTPTVAQQGTYNFLRTDVSARAAALNGSFVSMKDDPNVLSEQEKIIESLNPDGIAFYSYDFL